MTATKKTAVKKEKDTFSVRNTNDHGFTKGDPRVNGPYLDDVQKAERFLMKTVEKNVAEANKEEAEAAKKAKEDAREQDEIAEQERLDAEASGGVNADEEDEKKNESIPKK